MVCAAVGIVTRLQTEYPKNCGLIPSGARYLSLLQSIQPGSGAHWVLGVISQG
jgi:hypothetical protein